MSNLAADVSREVVRFRVEDRNRRLDPPYPVEFSRALLRKLQGYRYSGWTSSLQLSFVGNGQLREKLNKRWRA